MIYIFLQAIGYSCTNMKRRSDLEEFDPLYMWIDQTEEKATSCSNQFRHMVDKAQGWSGSRESTLINHKHEIAPRILGRRL